MVIEAVQQNSTVLSAGNASKINKISDAMSAMSNAGTIQMVQPKKDKTIKDYKVFTPSSDNLSKDAYIKEQNAYNKARVNYYIGQFKSLGIMQKEKSSGIKIGAYKLTAEKDGYNIDTKAMAKALGQEKITVGELKSYLGIPDGYYKEHYGVQGGDRDTLTAASKVFIDTNVINTRYNNK